MRNNGLRSTAIGRADRLASGLRLFGTPLPLRTPSRESPMTLPEDLKQLLLAFNAEAVEYLVVGGYAVGAYAEPRATKDLDLFIRSGVRNSEAVFRALAAFGAPLAALTPADFRDDPNSVFQIGLPQRASTFFSPSTEYRSMRHGRSALKPPSATLPRM